MESFMKRVDSESQGYFHHKLPQGNSVTVFRELNSFFFVCGSGARFGSDRPPVFACSVTA
jgi:hypothetical protein